MNNEEVKKLKEDDCVLLAAFVQKPSCGKVEDGSVLDKFGAIQLSAPNAYGDTVLRVLPEQVVSRCTVSRGLMKGDIVLCSSPVTTGVGFVIGFHDSDVIVKLANNCFVHQFRKSNVTLLIGAEEVQDRVERAQAIAAKKQAYAKGGMPAVEKLMAGGAAKSNEEGGEV